MSTCAIVISVLLAVIVVMAVGWYFTAESARELQNAVDAQLRNKASESGDY